MYAAGQAVVLQTMKQPAAAHPSSQLRSLCHCCPHNVPALPSATALRHACRPCFAPLLGILQRRPVLGVSLECHWQKLAWEPPALGLRDPKFSSNIEPVA